MLAERLFPGPFPLLKSLNSVSDASASLTSRNRSDPPALSFIHLGVHNRGRIPMEPPSFPNSHTHSVRGTMARSQSNNQRPFAFTAHTVTGSRKSMTVESLMDLAWLTLGSEAFLITMNDLCDCCTAVVWKQAYILYIPWLRSCILLIRMDVCSQSFSCFITGDFKEHFWNAHYSFLMS